MLRRLFQRQAAAPAPAPQTWEGSQRYECDHAIGFMREPFFQKLHADWREGKFKASSGHRDPLMIQEFFGGDRTESDRFFSHITGKRCLDIGPSVISPLAMWDVAAERYAIEPLLDEIEDWQKKNLGASCYRDMTGICAPAEKIEASLVGRIDGAILCRNMLDHTPQWPFILANISSYAASGCKLLLWTDLDHRGESDEGHYNITEDKELFKRLVLQLGFNVVREYSHSDRSDFNWGCFAEKH